MKAIDELFAAPEWDQTRREEIANSISHGFGLAAAIVATPFLCMAAARQPNRPRRAAPPPPPPAEPQEPAAATQPEETPQAEHASTQSASA